MGKAGFIDVPGGTIYFEVEGSGHPLLLIHGGLGDHRMWDAQMPAFAGRYRVIRYDTRGFGRTETEDVEFSERADAVAVLDHVGAESAHVVGQSRGGIFALDLVLEHPDRVDALVGVAGGIGGYTPQLPEGTTPPAWEEMEGLWKSKAWEQLAEAETRLWVDGWRQPPTRVEPAIRRKVHDWILTTYQAEKVEGKPRRLDPPAAGRLAEVHVPTLVMIGEVDEPAGVVAGRHLAASVAGARLEAFSGVAHMIQMEQPARFNALVLDFLAEADRRREAALSRA